MRKRPAVSGLAPLLLALVPVACAREEMPPGTGPDFEPPQVREMYPTLGSAVPDMDGEAYLEFDEPLADPRSVERVIEKSPSWLYEVKAGRSTIKIRPRDGWRTGVVYTFRIPPGVRDLVRNQTREPIVMRFTTGTRFLDTRVSGRVWDRESVRLARDISILLSTPDSVPYSAVTDTAGAFALLGLPVGDYWAFGYRDQNRNQVLDRGFEPYDSALVRLVDSTSVAEVDLWITPPDSTAPILTDARAADSLTVRLEFDDLLDPDAPLDSAFVLVVARPEGEVWPVSGFVVGVPPFEDSTGLEAGEPDSLRAGRQAPPGVMQEAREAGAPDSAGPEVGEVERARPERTVPVRLSTPLRAGEYGVSAGGFVNLRDLVGGGDTVFVYEAPPAAESEEGEPILDAPDGAEKSSEEDVGGGEP